MLVKLKHTLLAFCISLVIFCNRGSAAALRVRAFDENGNLNLQSLSKEDLDAICYAERYSYLYNKFCDDDDNTCDVDKLRKHYEKDGKKKHLIYGCHERDVQVARPSSQSLSMLEQLRIQSDELVNPLQLHVLIFETDSSLVEDMVVARQTTLAGISTTIFGIGEEYQGYGTKWSIVLPVLKDMPKNALVAIIDGRDVLLNIKEEHFYSTNGFTRAAVNKFIMAYRSLTFNKPGAVVMSAEAQCCVTALTHAEPGDYFDSITGLRSHRACASGEEGCRWVGDEQKLPWSNFQEEIAKERTGLDLEDVYLNAGTIVGRPMDLINIIETADIYDTEDDQAVFTDLMYNRPDLIILDYAQELFGVARWRKGLENGCLFDNNTNDKPSLPFMNNKKEDASALSSGSLIHLESKTTPLFLHTPGQFFDCYYVVARKLQVDNVGSLELDQRKLSMNYGPTDEIYNTYCKCKKLGKPEDCEQVDLEDPMFEGYECPGNSGGDISRQRKLVQVTEDNDTTYRVTICHKAFHTTISVGQSDLSSHIKLGDSIGPCSSVEVDADDEEDENEEEDESAVEDEDEDEEEELESTKVSINKNDDDADDSEDNMKEEEIIETEEDDFEEVEDSDDNDDAIDEVTSSNAEVDEDAEDEIEVETNDDEENEDEDSDEED